MRHTRTGTGTANGAANDAAADLKGGTTSAAAVTVYSASQADVTVQVVVVAGSPK